MNYKKVIKDFNSGVIDKKKVTLVMDNDSGYWRINTDDDREHDRRCDELEKIYGKPKGYRDIVDVLNAAGVSCEWC